MKLLRTPQSLSALKNGSVVSIGNFDGVHCGHQALLSLLRQQAQERQLPLVILLFEPQPCEYFHPTDMPPRIYRLRDKIIFLQEQGVDYVYCLKFNETLAKLSPDAFIERYIFSLLQARYVLVGCDFRFGTQRAGDFSFLKTYCEKRSCEVHAFPDFLMTGERVSSTKIRELLIQDHLAQAKRLLGRSYSFCGRIVKGAGLGRTIHIPTANLRLGRSKFPLHGVYCVNVKRKGKPIIPGIANVGTRPSVNGSEKNIEIHLLDFNEVLYGERIQVFFLHKLRNEMKFISLDALVDRIGKDIEAARAYHLEHI